MTEIEPMCDFCWEPKWGRSFRSDLGIQPVWHACSTCGAFIDARNWNALLLRGVDRRSEKYPNLPRRVIADGTKHVHDLFREHFHPEKI